MHPKKLKIVYCKDRSRTQIYPTVTFISLGFLFRPRSAMTKYGRLSASFLSMLPFNGCDRGCRDGRYLAKRPGNGSNWPSNVISRYVAGGTTTVPSIGQPCMGSVGI